MVDPISPETQAKDGSPYAALGFALPVEANLATLRKASEALMLGYSKIAARQAEFVQAMTIEIFSDFQAMFRVRRPDELIESWTSFAATFAERSAKAAHALGDELRLCMRDSVDAALGEVLAVPADFVAPDAVKRPFKVNAATRGQKANQ